MKTLSVVGGLGMVAALIVVCLNQSKSRRELAELQAAAKSAAETPQSSASRADLPPAIAADLRSLTTKMLSAAQASQPAQATSAASPRRPSISQEQEQELMRDAYRGEGVDPVWRREAESKLDVAVHAALPPGSRLLSVACRTTMCLMEISHEDPNSAHGQAERLWVTSLAQSWDGTLFIAGERQEGGQLVQTVISSKGDKLPIENSL